MSVLPIVKNAKKTIRAWAFFDWANSSYSLVITTAIFPVYYSSLSDEPVTVLGKTLELSALYSFAITAAYLLIALASPILSGIADYSGRKKIFLRVFTYIGSAACISLFFFTGIERLALGTIGFMIATIGFAGALVFYNAYLPEITTPDRYDAVSAKGFSYGYVGSLILLLICLVIILKPNYFGISEGTLPTRLSFLLVGLWWLGFANIPFRQLPKDDKEEFSEGIFWKGFKELKGVWQQLKGQKSIIRFLISFFFYSAGVQTVLFLASTFAEVELDFAAAEMIAIILLLQVVAIFGAFLFARVSKSVGNKLSLIIMLVIWLAICILAYFVHTKPPFYAIAGLVGFVMGGIQSLSRSTYSKLIPEGSDDTTSYFSFYDVLEKMAIVLGTFSFGLITALTGGMRSSMLFMVLFFILGIALMLGVNVPNSEPPLAKAEK